jgi:antitoxin component of RelBE/YafQ-DinJ toxin-antitoxin module
MIKIKPEVFCIRVETDLAIRIKQQAEELGLTPAALIRVVLEQNFK